MVLVEYHFYYLIRCVFHTLSLSLNSIVMTCIETQLGIFYHFNRTYFLCSIRMQTDDSSYNYDNCANENRIANVLHLVFLLLLLLLCVTYTSTYTQKRWVNLMVSVDKMKHIIYGWSAFQWNSCIYLLSHACIPSDRFILQFSSVGWVVLWWVLPHMGQITFLGQIA